jgi:hypothetical protein
MRSSAARIAANRANAARSTGPRTARGKAISSRNALTHGAYASDDTLLAVSGDSLATIGAAVDQIGGNENPAPMRPRPDSSGVVPAIRIHPEAVPQPSHATAVAGSSTSYLATLTAQYQPAGPTEIILVRRLAALALRLDRLNDAIASLPALGERRALVDHLVERYAIDAECGSLRDQPDWRGPLRRYDDPSYVNPYPEDVIDDPARDPDPATCALVHALSSRRAETFSRLETAAGRAFTATLNQLRAEQAARRRAESYPPLEYTPRRDLLNAVDDRVRQILTAHGLNPDRAPIPDLPSTPTPASPPAAQNTAIDRNEATATAAPIPTPASLQPDAGTAGPATEPDPATPTPSSPPAPVTDQPIRDNEPTATGRSTGNEATGSTPAATNKPALAFHSPAAALLAKTSGAHHPFTIHHQHPQDRPPLP